MSSIDLSQAVWRKSTRSNGSGDCVEVTDHLPGVIGLRDSKNPAGSALVVPAAGWTAFVRHVGGGSLAADH
ncbi:DUF397 domain-containing protein [Fodinicola acaciae]|uniref:DUF397 domain-containing protein n=1 Tax=Fodinicola acaciae TaxID=2681555 RepID=UPI0013D8A06D|nr:DUF397 domain-containing protein [Fodinicola acaciae]